MADGSLQYRRPLELLATCVADMCSMRAVMDPADMREWVREAVLECEYPPGSDDPRRKLAEAIVNSDDVASDGVIRVFLHVFAAGRRVMFKARVGEVGPFELDRRVKTLIAFGKRAAFWQRPLEEWRPETDGRLALFQLARHLFVKWTMPDFMDGVWLSTRADADERRDWYMRIGGGGPVLPMPGEPEMTSRQAHYLMHAVVEHDQSNAIGRAVLWAHVMAMGGTPALACQLCRSVIGQGQLFAPDRRRFWHAVIRFFIDHPDLMETQIDAAVKYFNARRADEGPGYMQTAIRRWTVQTLMRHMRVWDQVNNLEDGRPFKPSGRQPYRRDGWALTEICNARELNREGEHMRHCVGGYAIKSIMGLATYWSLRRIDAGGYARRRLTVELDYTGTIIMARGRLNRWPALEEMAVLGDWAAAEGLKIGRDLQANVLISNRASDRQ